MRGQKNRIAAVASALAGWAILTVAVAAEAHWPTWRGPGMTGIAEGADPPVTFGERENLKWKVAVPGSGASTPILWGDRLFLLTALPVSEAGGLSLGQTVRLTLGQAPGRPPFGGKEKGKGKGRGGFGIRQPDVPYRFEVICVDRRDGKTLWRRAVREAIPHEGHHPDHGFASFSPVTDGAYLWASFGSRGLHCLTMDGEVKWSRDFGAMTTRASFGEGSSPALVGDAVVVLMDQEGDSFIEAVDKVTGKTIWRQPRDEPSSWSTPLAVAHGGRTEIVVNGTNRVRGYDPADGKVLWECGGQTLNVVPTPVAGFGMVFCASGFRGSALQAIELGRRGDLTGSDAVRWEIKRNTPYVPSPLLYGERLFYFSVNTPRLSCANARTGQLHFSAEDIEGMRGVYASPVGAADRVYLACREGAVAVIRNSDRLEVLALNRLEDGFDASPAIVGNELYLRGRRHLYCFGKR